MVTKHIAAETYNTLIEEHAFMKDTLAKLYGMDKMFICGGSKDLGPDNLPDMIMVCPTVGADGFAVYKKYKDYSAPSY
jgi:hypothetical protein